MSSPIPTPTAPSGDARRLVLGTAIGFTADQVRSFVESLRENFTGAATMFIHWPAPHLARFLESRGIEPVPVARGIPFRRPVNARRYKLYRDYLRPRVNGFDQVMISDTRDVVIQAPPFAGIGGKCHFYLERAGQTIGGEEYNSRWVRACFPADEATTLLCRPVSCSGVSIGGGAAMLAYVEKMTAGIDALPRFIHRLIGPGYDQAIHNGLVHPDSGIDGVTVENNLHVATMGLEPRALYRLDECARIRAQDGFLLPVCHQYNRFPDILDAVTARYAAR